MKYNSKPVASLDAWELNAALKSIEDMEAKRLEASKHPKFQKMPFPEINNQAYLNYKQQILDEIEKRKSNA